MQFYEKIGEFQKLNIQLSRSSLKSEYRFFVENLPKKGIANAQWFYMLPNYSKNVKEIWKKLLIKSKIHYEKALSFIKDEWVFGEFNIDTSDAAFNLWEVWFLLSEYRESQIDFVYIKYDDMCLKRTNKDRPIEED